MNGLLVAAFLVAAGEAAPAPAGSFRVTGRSLAEVYVDAGQAQGLARGARLSVLSGGAPVAELEVTRLDASRAACRTISLLRPIRTGDVVVRAAAAPAAKPVLTAATQGVTAEPVAATSGAPPRAAHETIAAETAPAAVAERPAPEAVATMGVRFVLASMEERSPTPSPPRLAVPPARPGDAKTFAVRYRSAANVYLDGGASQGLAIGDRLQAADGRTILAELEVVYVAEQSASCRVVSEARPLKTGDRVVRVARGEAAAPAAAESAAKAAGTVSPALDPRRPASSEPNASSAPAATATATAQASRGPAAPWARVSGSAAIGIYQSSDRTGSGLGFSERTARVDLTASQIDGRPLSFTLRGRSRQDVRDRRLSDRTPRSERTDRLYEVALRYEPPAGRFAVDAGRIGLYRFVGIGYLDGALARYKATPALSVGAFGGRAAEIEGLGWNGTGAKYGGFLQLAPGGRYSTSGYDALVAFVRETADGDVSREYLSLESRFSGGRRFSLFERAELDLNRGWRKDATGRSLQLSNVSLSGNLQLARSAWAFVSYDGRRSYRYYRNRLVPEEVFDDLLHQGLRAGVNVARPGGFGASAGFGMSLKEQDPRHPELNVANAYSWSGGVRHASLLGLSVGVDGSGFSNGYADGAVISARAGRRFGAGHLLDLSYGRSLYRVTTTQEDRSTQWFRFTGRFELGRHAYVTGDLEYDKGDDLEGPRGLVEAGWIF